MKKYLVGGAVRDKIMGAEPKDFDYVLVNTNELEVLSHGYKKISNNFPVYSHYAEPEAQFALARTETKVGKGYNGFSVKTDDILLEEDLLRRDFTINAMALDENGTVIDPFHGQDDIKNKIIRHVGEHFREDPLRIIRTARFQARLNFSVHESTKTIITEMLNEGMLGEVHISRIFTEFEKSVAEKYPVRFLRALEDLGILDFLFNTLDINEIKNNIKYIQNTDELSLIFGILLANQKLNVIKNQRFVKNLPNRYKDQLIMSLKCLDSVIHYSSFSDEKKAELFVSHLRLDKNLNYCLSILGRYFPDLDNSKMLKDWTKFKSVDLSTATQRQEVIDKLAQALKI